MTLAGADLAEKFPEISPIILQLLYNRQLTRQSDIDAFLSANYDDYIHDPFLFKDMPKAMERLFSAVKKREKVMIYGDYDADGVCSTTILWKALSALGLDSDIYIPFREGEGYGLNQAVAERIAAQGYQLVITVDCGISNAAEIAYLKEQGIETLVLDHHEEPLARPPALAIINPSLSDSGYPPIRLCAAGVAFKFVQAIISYQDRINSPVKLPEGFDKWLLDLVAIATVGDIMPLLDENRIFVKYGLTVLSKTRNLGLARLMEMINNKNELDAEYLGWRIVPRLNAAGRVNHASVAFNLLVAKDNDEADKWVECLEKNNRDRQQITEKIVTEALARLEDLSDEQRVIFIAGDGWPAGVVGLVAGKLSDRFHRPALVFTRTEEAGVVKYSGSGRSIEEFDITAGLKECHELLARYGGHPQACGLTIFGEDNYQQFQDKLNRLAKEKLTGVELLPVLNIETEIRLSDISWQLLDELEKFEPFGEGNEQPLFCAKKLIVEQVQTVGADGKHLKVQVSQAGSPNIHKLIGFSFGDWCARLCAGEEIDIVFELGVNEWNGNREIQLKIVDLKKSD
jgi:single-stranded-DNA-specific exonuclease